MGIYYNSYYYSDINNNSRIQLSSLDSILEDKDIHRGYIIKSELFRIFDLLLKNADFGENAHVVITINSTYGDEETETIRLPVKDV